MGGREGKLVNNEILGEFPEGLLALLDKNPDFSITDRDGNNALHISCSTNALECMKIWRKRKGDFNSLNEYNENALTVAVHYGILDSSKYICENVSEINYRQLNKNGENILDIAAQSENEKLYDYIWKFILSKNDYELIFMHLMKFKITEHQLEMVFKNHFNPNLLTIEFLKFYEHEDFHKTMKLLLKLERHVFFEFLKSTYQSVDKFRFIDKIVNSALVHLFTDILKIDFDYVKDYLFKNTITIFESLKDHVYECNTFFNLIIDFFDIREVLKFRNANKQHVFIILLNTGKNSESVYHLGKILEKHKMVEAVNLAAILEETDLFELTFFDYNLKRKNVMPYNYLIQISGKEVKYDFKHAKVTLTDFDKITNEQLQIVREIHHSKIDFHSIKSEFSTEPFLFLKDIFTKKISKNSTNLNFNHFGIKVLFINNRADLELCVSDLSEQKIISMDMETAITTNKIEVFSLIQIATLKKVYLIDALSLFKECKLLLKGVFENPNILKLIFSCMSDIKILFFYLQIRLIGFLDICILFNKHKNIKQGFGLKGISEEVL